MSAKSTRSDANAHPSRQVLAELPLRVVLFLGAVCRYDVIRTTLRAGGYGLDEHQEGCRLLQAVHEYPSLALDHASDERARSALNAIDDYARTHFVRFRAMAERYFPSLTGLFPSLTEEPASALHAMRTLLDWLNAAESVEQKQIVRKLAERGLTLAERRRLTELVATATAVETSTITSNATSTNATSANAGVSATGASATSTDAQEQALLDLYDWYSDWAATARALIKRRDHRAALGIGEKRAKRTATALHRGALASTDTTPASD